MEGVGRGDLVGDRLGAAVGGLRFSGFFQLTAESIRDIADLGLVETSIAVRAAISTGPAGCLPWVRREKVFGSGQPRHCG